MLGLSMPAVLAVAFLVLLLLIVSGMASLYQKVPPNTALIVFGGRRKRDKGYKIIKGGGEIIWPLFQSTRTMSLELMPLDIESVEANSSQGVKITVDAVAQVKIGGTDEAMNTAAEQLLTKNIEDIKLIAQHSLQGHLRGIIAELTVEEIYKDRESFQQKVADQAKQDMANMGLEIVSFTVKEITDSHGYMEALGKPRIAQVLRDASVAEAEADQERRQKVAAADQAAKTAELAAQIAIAEATKEKDVQVAQFQTVSKTEQAKADIAYDLQKAEMEQQLATKNGAVAIETQRQAALAAEQAVQVAQNKQRADVVIPAQAHREATVAQAEGEAKSTQTKAGGEAEAIKLRAEAEAHKTKVTGIAQGESDKAVGEGEAAAQKAKLIAEAEGQRQLAQARAADSEVNLRQFTIERYFETQLKIGEAMAEALSKVGAKISFTQVGPSANGHDNGMIDFLKQFPELAAVLNAQSQALAGKDLTQIMENVVKLIKTGKANGEGSAEESLTKDADSQ